MDISKIGDRDLYQLIGLSSDCTAAEIRKAYRKKALECHPDKNPDNPKAGELFNELTEALAILLDESARATYDRVLNAKKAAKLRHKQLDEKRKKFKADLESKEAQYFSFKDKVKTDEEKLKDEIARLRKEGTKLLQEEMKLIQEEISQSLNKNIPESGSGSKIKVQWHFDENEEEPIYTKEVLEKIFCKYGDLVAVVCSYKKGKGKGIVEFKERSAAELALKIELGLLKCPLKLKWLDKDPNTKKSNVASESLITERDYESLTLRKMRQAEERKRLIQELQNEDGN